MGPDLASGAIYAIATLAGVAGFALAGSAGAIGVAALAFIIGAIILPSLGAKKAPVQSVPRTEAPSDTSVTEPPAVAAPQAIPENRIDDLTGLANENGLMAWFAERMPQLVETGRSIVVLSASIEGFDAIERGRGKSVADKVQVEVAKRIAVFAGDEGIAARTGGGEFASKVSVVPEHSIEYASEIAAKMAEVLQRPVELPEGVIWIGACVGAAAGPASEGTGVLGRARAALVKAKQVGLGHYVVDKG